MTNRQSRGITFILCCYNSEKVISGSIQALQEQSNQSIPYEVILVDNNCIDGTVKIAQDMWSRPDVSLQIVSESTPGLIHARKKGVKFARYDYISFVDDDNFLEKDWVTKVCRIFEEKPNVGAIGSHNNPILGDSPPEWFAKVQMNYACGQQQPASGYVRGERKHLWGAGLCIRRTIIDEIFSPKHELLMTGRTGKTITSGEDSEICFLCSLMGWDLWYEDDLFLSHKIAVSRLNWKYFCMLHEGFGCAYVILDIYKRKIDGLQPPRFKEVFPAAAKKFLNKLWQNRGFPKEPEDGNLLHKEIYYFWGVVKTAHRLRKSYESIVRAIYSREY